MDLSKLLALGEISPLLEALACTDDYLSSLRSLRLVSKEISQHALMGLKEFTLNFKGCDADTVVSGAILLQRTKLSELTLYMDMTDVFQPTESVKAFLCSVGKALVSLTSLCVHVSNTCKCEAAVALLDEALAELISTCSSLTCFYCFGERMFTALLPVLSKHCVRLNAVDLRCIGAMNNPVVQEWFDQQSRMLPNVKTLTLQGDRDKRFPNMSKNEKISTLNLYGFKFHDDDYRAEWLHLPSRLCHFHCDCYFAGPPTTATNSTPALSTLVSMIMSRDDIVPLHALAQILTAAPSLQRFETHDHKASNFMIDVEVCESSPADFAAVNARKELFPNTKFWFTCDWIEDETTLLPYIAAIPIVTVVTDAQIDYSLASNVGPLLAAIQGIKKLMLSADDLENDGLLAVAVNKDVETLGICSKLVTTNGVVALCLLLPKILSVNCSSLSETARADCERLLKEHGRVVDFST